MIKKFNIVLVLVFGLMMLLKLLRQDGAVDTSPEVVFENPAMAVERSELSPRVYYVWSPPFFKVDPLSRHNGFVLDQLQAIFPRAELVKLDRLDQQSLDLLRSDPRAVICQLEDSEQLKGFPRSSVSIAWVSLYVLTLRSEPWKYRDPASLKGLRLCAAGEVISSRFVQKLSKEQGFSLTGVEKVFSDRKVLAETDGLLEAASSDWTIASVNTYSLAYENYRRSPPIKRLNLTLFANNSDTNFAAAVIRDFEAGFKRLRESGERQRICDYYGFQN